MLVATRPSCWRVLRQIGTPLAVLLLFPVVSFLHHRGYTFRIFAIPDLPLSLCWALGILLGFRTNSAYDRWWEARTLWGALINSSRTWARQLLSFQPDPNVARQMIYAQIAYVHTLRCHLRREGPWIQEVTSRLPESVTTKLRAEQNFPAALLHELGRQVAALVDAGKLSDLRLQRLDQTLTDLTNVQGGCERIKNTPLPRQYDYFPAFLIYVYCMFLPLAIVEELGPFTPAATALIAIVFLILNRIGKNLEDPFDTTIYGTPMVALSRTIEISLLQQLGETELPPAVTPRLGILP